MPVLVLPGQLASVAEHAGFSLTWSHTRRQVFSVARVLSPEFEPTLKSNDESCSTVKQ